MITIEQLKDLNYMTLNEKSNSDFRIKTYHENYIFLLKNIIEVILRSIYGFVAYVFQKKKTLTQKNIVFYYLSNNNKRALESVQHKTASSALYSQDDFRYRHAWRYAILSLPTVLKESLKAKGYIRKALFSEFVEVCLTYSYVKNAEWILNQISPRYLVLANDHIAHARAFMRVAQSLNISTIYIQHASVTEKFPPLEFNYAFLDGVESYEKYIATNNSKSIIFISGGSRFDEIEKKVSVVTNRVVKNNVIKIGIALNKVDDLSRVKRLVLDITDQFSDRNLILTLRVHPRMSLDEIKPLFTNNKFIQYSDPLLETPFDFIANNDIFISGESSIHLDISLSNKKSLYYSFTGRKKDSYGYIRKGLIQDITDNPIKCLEDCIGKKALVNESLCRYYVGNFGTSYWGKSSSVIADAINSLQKNDLIDMNIWKIENKVYELNY